MTIDQSRVEISNYSTQMLEDGDLNGDTARHYARARYLILHLSVDLACLLHYLVPYFEFKSSDSGPCSTGNDCKLWK